MKLFLRAFVFLALALFGPSAVAQQQQIEIFLKVDDVKGNATNSAHKDQIVVTGFSVGTTNISGSAGGLSVKSPLHLVVQKNIDKASPILAQAAATGKAFSRLELFVLTISKGDFATSYTIILEDVRVVAAESSVVFDRNTGSSHWTETVAFHYSKITWAFGSIKAGYDFTGNKANLVPKSGASSEDGGVVDAQMTSALVPAATGAVAVSYSRTDAGHVTLSFGAEVGKIYRILGSQNVEGPYELLAIYPAAETGPVVLPLAATTPTQFFRIELAQ
jgi:type VI secretion system Hcp family effector